MYIAIIVDRGSGLMDRAKCICPVCQTKNSIGAMCLTIKKNRRLDIVGAEGQGTRDRPLTKQTDIRHWIYGHKWSTVLLRTWGDLPTQQDETTIKRSSR